MAEEMRSMLLMVSIARDNGRNGTLDTLEVTKCDFKAEKAEVKSDMIFKFLISYSHLEAHFQGY